jgi:hypothetical protein
MNDTNGSYTAIGSGISTREILTCPVCAHYPRGKTLFCQEGHIVCEHCLKYVVKRAVCPTCMDQHLEYSRVTDILVQKSLYHLNVKCINNAYGCQISMQLQNIARHEKWCSKRQVRCPASVNGCKFYGELTMIMEHIKETGCTEVIYHFHYYTLDGCKRFS